jgi:hypothetical protein
MSSMFKNALKAAPNTRDWKTDSLEKTAGNLV